MWVNPHGRTGWVQVGISGICVPTDTPLGAVAPPHVGVDTQRLRISQDLTCGAATGKHYVV